MSDDTTSKPPVLQEQTKTCGPRESLPQEKALRQQLRREKDKIAKDVEIARANSDVPALLRLLITEMMLWTRELKMETLTLFEDTEYGRFRRQLMKNVPPTLNILPGYVTLGFVAVHDAYDLVELLVGESQAQSLAKRLGQFDELRREFGEAVSRLASTWDDKPGGDVEQLVVIDRHRSALKHAAFDLCRYVDTLAQLAPPPNGNGHPRQVMAPEDDTTNRLQALRRLFDSAVNRLDAIPDTELSPTGQPFVKECADAMLAFAAWFGEQTPDDVAIHGNAYRVQYALGGLSGVIDWVALHWSVPFAKEIDQETGELVEQADAFDQAVVKAFKVPSKRHELRLRRKPLPRQIYADLEQRIAQIAGLAYRLGGRLQRVAVWASEGHTPTERSGLDALKRGRTGSPHENTMPKSSNDSEGKRTVDTLLDDANYCLMTLGNMRRDYSTMDSVSRRMVGGGENWDFGTDGDEAVYRDARQRVDADRGRLLEPLTRLLAWGNERGMEISNSVDTFQHGRTSGHCASLCEAYELDVRNVMSALIIEQARRPKSTAPTAPRDPAAVLLAAETMKCITARLLAHAIMLRIGKPSEYDDREQMNQDIRLAQKHGYLLVSIARQLSLDADPLTRILREDRLWEYPIEKDDVAVFRAAAHVSERICTEARIWCAEAGVDLDVILNGQATTPSVAASPRSKVSVASAPSAVVPTSNKTTRQADPGGPTVVLGRPGMPCRVLNVEKSALTDAEHAVVDALLKAGAHGLSKDALESVRPSARCILKRLSKDPDWAKVISRPGKTNGRYRLRL